jgi:hypothetical protein
MASPIRVRTVVVLADAAVEQASGRGIAELMKKSTWLPDIRKRAWAQVRHTIAGDDAETYEHRSFMAC